MEPGGAHSDSDHLELTQHDDDLVGDRHRDLEGLFGGDLGEMVGDVLGGGVAGALADSAFSESGIGSRISTPLMKRVEHLALRTC
jgi:hypothetical protein